MMIPNYLLFIVFPLIGLACARRALCLIIKDFGRVSKGTYILFNSVAVLVPPVLVIAWLVLEYMVWWDNADIDTGFKRYMSQESNMKKCKKQE